MAYLGLLILASLLVLGLAGCTKRHRRRHRRHRRSRRRRRHHRLPASSTATAAAAADGSGSIRARDHRRAPEEPERRPVRLRPGDPARRREGDALEELGLAEAAPRHGGHPGRGPLRRARHRAVQPRPRRAPGPGRHGIPAVARNSREPSQDGELREGKTPVHGGDRELLAE